MNNTIFKFGNAIFLLSALVGCSPAGEEELFAYQLGTLDGFCELVNAGVKQLALSSTMTPAEMDKFYPLAKEVAQKHGVELYREADLIVTDLFPADVAANKEVLLVYQGATKDQYLQLKADREALEKAGKYQDRARQAIARRFGRMLSYTPQGINRLLAKQTSFRTMKDFGVHATNLFLYYRDLPEATRFYSEILGLELLADYNMATIFRMAADSYLILVDATKGMHTPDEPKTVALALLTDQLEDWWNYLQQQNVAVRYPYKTKEGGPHDGFVAIDPEGYLLEFETFKQHPENERFIPLLDRQETIFPVAGKSQVPPGLGFKSTITWLYYRDILHLQNFYQEVLGFELVADQGWTKIYRASETGYIGLVDERRGMHQFTEEKAVNVSFILDDLDGWFDYVDTHRPFELRSEEITTGPEGKYRAFVGYDPEGYYLEFDRFYDHPSQEKLMDYLQQNALTKTQR